MTAATSLILAAFVLARKGEFDWATLIPIGIVVLLWIIGAAMNAAGKSSTTSNRPQAKNAPRPPRATAARQPPAVRVMQQQRRVIPRPPKVKARRRGAAPTPATPLFDVPPPRNHPPQPPAMPPPIARASTGRDARGGIDAKTLARWLTPAVMRQQYILTEVFDPPPGLGGRTGGLE